MKLLAVVPVHNEEATVVAVLDALADYADRVIIVDDESTDRTPRLLAEWRARSRVDAVVIRLDRNRGAAGALKAGFSFLCGELASGRVDEDDVVVTLDADGQHVVDEITRLLTVYRHSGADHILGRRCLAHYPGWKRWGNWFMSWWASLLGGYRFRDVECGFRLLQLRILPDIMQHYVGTRYSNGQELAIISSLCGHRLHNTCPVTVPFYRRSRGTTVLDGVIAAGCGVRAAVRTRRSRARDVSREASAVSVGDGQ